jgi:hypothetical protein
MSADTTTIQLAYNEHKSLSQLAREMGMSRKTLFLRAKKLGLVFGSRKSNRSINQHRYIGRKYGKLTIVGFAGFKEGQKHRMSLWNARCSCGNKLVVSSKQLADNPKRGKKGCGCSSPKNRKGNKHPRWQGYKDLPLTYWNTIKNSARYRDRDFKIDMPYAYRVLLKQGNRCALSGQDISFTGSHPPSLDRIDSNLGYIKGNIQWLSREVNLMKMNLPQNIFLEICRKITNHCV